MGVRRLIVANGPNIFQMLLVLDLVIPGDASLVVWLIQSWYTLLEAVTYPSTNRALR